MLFLAIAFDRDESLLWAETCQKRTVALIALDGDRKESARPSIKAAGRDSSPMPMETRHKGIGRLVVYLGWGVQLLNGAFFHHHHAIAHRHGFGLIMGDVNHGGSHFLVELAKFHAHLQSHLGVQVGKGLIKQKDLGSADGARPTATRWR